MRILIVEDEHKIANSIKQGLEQESYAVDVAYVFGKTGIFSVNGLSTHASISPMRKKVQRQPSYKVVHVFGPISLYGLCSTFI